MTSRATHAPHLSPPRRSARHERATFDLWKKKFAHLGVSERRRLRQVEDENRRLPQLVDDLTLDKHMLTETLRKKG